MLIGSWMSRDDAYQVAIWLAVLNHVAFAFAIAEFIVGVPTFFPKSAVTDLIYNSKTSPAARSAFLVLFQCP